MMARFDWRVQIAEGADLSDPPERWQFRDISVRHSDPIATTYGRKDEWSTVSTRTLDATVDNRSGEFSRLQRNTPIRVTYGDSDNERFAGYLSAAEPRWDQSTQDAVVELDAGGIMRRLTQGQKPLRSTIVRRVIRFDPIGYWPLEQGENAAQATSPVPGVQALVIRGDVDFASIDGPGGSDRLATFAEGSGWTARVPDRVDLDGDAWHVELLMNLDEPPTTAQPLFTVQTTGTVYRWTVWTDATAIWLIATDRDGNQLHDSGRFAHPELFGDWTRIRVTAQPDGGELRYLLGWFRVGNDGFNIQDGLPGATQGHVTHVFARYNDADLDGIGIGHVVAWEGFDRAILVGVDTGFDGERAGHRIERICSEESIPLDIVSDHIDTEPMGPQPVASVMDILRECAAADGGVLYESGFGLAYQSRRDRMNQRQPAIVASMADQDLARPPEPTRDDQQLVNDFEATRAGGGSVRVVDQESVDDDARYDRSQTVNVQRDDQLGDVAGWGVHVGTVDAMRWPLIQLNLTRNEAIRGPVLGLELGRRMFVAHRYPQFVGTEIDVIVDGWSERFTNDEWEFKAQCVPADPWVVGVVDDVELGRVDTDGTELDDLVIEPAPVLNQGHGFEDPALMDTWQATNGTVTRTRERAREGAAAALLTPDGSSFAVVIEGTVAAAATVSAGLDYTLSGWFYSEQGWDPVRLFVTWFDAAGGNVLNDFGPLVAVPAGRWTLLTHTATAPATAERARWRARMEGTPAETDRLVVDEARLTNEQGRISIVTTAGPPWTIDPDDYPLDLIIGTDNDRNAEPEAVTAVDMDTFEDSFTREVVDGWGTSDSGDTWTVDGSAVGNFAVDGARGTVMLPANNDRHFTSAGDFLDIDVVCSVNVGVAATGAGIGAGPLLRYQDPDNWYGVQLIHNIDGTLQLGILKRVAGSFTIFETIGAGPHTPGSATWIRLRVFGLTIEARAWQVGEDEPSGWMVSATDTDIGTSGAVGTHTNALTGNTNSKPVTVSYDDFRTSQRFRVIRAVNGVEDFWEAGTDVRLRQPTIIS